VVQLQHRLAQHSSEGREPRVLRTSPALSLQPAAGLPRVAVLQASGSPLLPLTAAAVACLPCPPAAASTPGGASRDIVKEAFERMEKLFAEIGLWETQDEQEASAPQKQRNAALSSPAGGTVIRREWRSCGAVAIALRWAGWVVLLMAGSVSPWKGALRGQSVGKGGGAPCLTMPTAASCLLPAGRAHHAKD
jgi:hypothetical protein